MRDVRFKLQPPLGGPGPWTHARLSEFLLSLPNLFLLHGGEQPIPPCAVLNEVFTSGKWDAGMSGGCEWKPFEISDDEYDELVQALALTPNYRFITDAALAEIKSLRQWRSKRLSKYSGRLGKRSS